MRQRSTAAAVKLSPTLAETSSPEIPSESEVHWLEHIDRHWFEKLSASLEIYHISSKVYTVEIYTLLEMFLNFINF